MKCLSVIYLWSSRGQSWAEIHMWHNQCCKEAVDNIVLTDHNIIRYGPDTVSQYHINRCIYRCKHNHHPHPTTHTLTSTHTPSHTHAPSYLYGLFPPHFPFWLTANREGWRHAALQYRSLVGLIQQDCVRFFFRINLNLQGFLFFCGLRSLRITLLNVTKMLHHLFPVFFCSC